MSYAGMRGWTAGLVGGLAAVFVAGIAIRIALWPQARVAGDLDEYVRWVHGIAVGGWGNAYDQNLSYPAVMVWIWGALALVQPAFATAVNAADLSVRAVMKAPAFLADLGIAACVAYWYRRQPRVAVAAVACFLLWPATWYLSAWWGQTEPIYVLPVLAALLAARANRPGLAAALLGIGLMTKPQALPLAVPFAAWFLANGGWRGALRAAVIVGAVAVVVWLPFVPAGGPMAYLRNLNGWQNGVFPLVSVKAWNPWWLLQEFGAGGGYVSDGTVLIGPVTFRLVALAAAAVAWVVVFIGVYRRPTPANLAMGLAAASLGAFVTLTTMHERYAYPAFVFLLLGWPRREVVAAWLALGVAFVLDLVYAVPPPGLTLPAGDVVSVAGAVVLTAVALAAIRWTWRGEPEDEAEQSSPTSSLGRVAEAPS